MAVTSCLNTGIFAILFIVSMTIFGGWFTLIPAFLVAWAITLLLRKVLNKTLPIPRGGAIFITGTSSGIGASATRHLVEQGWLVFCGVRRAADFDVLRDSVSKDAQARLIPVIVDITSPAAIASAVTTVTTELRKHDGILMGIINNAGYMEKGLVEMLPVEKWRNQLEVNVFGTVSVTQAFLPLLRETRVPGYTKRIIMISSGLGRSTFPNCGIYSASKHALEATTSALRQELQHWPIDVILVNPGVVRTNMDKSSRDTSDRNWEAYAHRVTEEVRAWYKQCISKQDAFTVDQRQQPTSVTDTQISAALRDSRPLSRYLAGADVALLPVGNFVPDVGADHIVAKTFQ